MNKLFVIPVLLIVFIIGSGSSCETKKTQAPESGPGSAAEPMKVEAATLVSEFDANKINAQDKYNGKYVQTSGYITNVSSAMDNYYIQFKHSNDPLYLGTSFQCYVSKEDASAVTNGQSVTVKGRVEDVTMTLIQLKDCSVVK